MRLIGTIHSYQYGHSPNKNIFYIRAFFILILLYIPPAVFSQTPSPTLAPSVAYRFQAKTAWAKLSVIALSFNHRFELECQSDYPMAGWILTNLQDSNPIAGNEENCGNSFKVMIAKSFSDCVLTVFIGEPDEQIPIVMNLGPEINHRYPLFTSNPFLKNPDRPYNALIENLYLQAQDAYAQENIQSALNLLMKALELDPTEPQILALMSQLQPQTMSHATQRLMETLLAKAQKAETDQDNIGAKNEYLSVLKIDAQNQAALKGLQQLQMKLHDQASEILEKDINSGNYQKSLMLLLQFKQIFPGDPHIPQWLDQIHSLANVTPAPDPIP